MAQHVNSEQRIRETARRIFLIEGRLHATTADIAKEAGVPRTSVHYYFRSRDILFKDVFNEALQGVSRRLNDVVESKLPFKSKIETFVDVFTSETLTYPYLETFVVTEIITQKFVLPDKNSPKKFNTFLKEIQKEMTRGTIHRMEPLQFILNLFALLVHPAITAPLYRQLFNIKSDRYRELLKDRRKVILQLIFK